MRGLAYFLIVLLPSLIIGMTVYLTRDWPPTGLLTIITWTVAWVVSMILVTVVYLLLIHKPNVSQKDEPNDVEQTNKERQQH